VILTLWREVLDERKTGEDEDGLDSQSLEGAEVGFDLGDERDGKTTCRGHEHLSRVLIGEEFADVVSCVDAEAGVGEGRQRDGLGQSPLIEVRWMGGARERGVSLRGQSSTHDPVVAPASRKLSNRDTA
jgi:hypothetical protein